MSVPNKISFASVLCFVLSIVFIAQAQDEPAPTQSVADAVSTLLAQTQQAPTQIMMTQAVQEALNQALTATAQAATPAPVDADTMEVVSTTEFELIAGPGNRAAFLAPNGERFVYLNRDRQMCLYLRDADTPERCVDYAEPISRIDMESIVWSPDSRYVTFTENFFIYLVDADIWVWDTTTDVLQNLTDDGDNRIEMGEDTWKSIDVAPTWLKDGRILFLRYSRVNDENLPPEIFVIAPDGSGLEQLGSIEEASGFAAYSLDVQADQLFFNFFQTGRDPENGLWTSAMDGSGARQIYADEGEYVPYSVTISPEDGRHVLINTPNRMGQPEPEISMMRLVEVESGEALLIDPDRYVSAAGWSPDGSALAYLVTDRRNEEESGLYITGTPGEAGRLILQGLFNAPTPRLAQPLTWGANNIILISRSPEEGVLLVELGS